jgi:RNA polymerase sigma-70 factor (ECF subfamily)
MTKSEFDSLYTQEYPRIYRMCLGYASGDPHLAEEWTQDVFIRIWEHIGGFRGESQLSTWIYRVTVNTCLQNLRAARRRPERARDPEQISQKEDTTTLDREALATWEQRLQALYRCINDLNHTNRTIVLLELEGIPQKEIAEVTGLSHQAIRTRIHRIKAEIQNKLKP